MLKPGPDMDFTLWLKDKVDMQFNGGGLTPTILGELYINWGYIGTYLGFFILGIVITLLEKYYICSEQAYFASFLVWIILSSIRGGLANVEINFILFGIVYFCIYFVSTFNIKKGSNNEKNSFI